MNFLVKILSIDYRNYLLLIIIETPHTNFSLSSFFFARIINSNYFIHNHSWRFQILNTPPDENFNRIVSLAKNHFKVRNASICLVNTDHQWYKAGHESEFWQP